MRDRCVAYGFWSYINIEMRGCKMRKTTWMHKAVSGVMLCALAVSLLGMPASADAKKKAKKEVAFDANGTYHARLGIQTADTLWITRWGYFDKSANTYYKTEKDNQLCTNKNETYDGTFTDVEIKGNGTYTVSLDGADFAGETTISQLHVATDIPLSADVKFSDVSVEIDGKKTVSFADGYMEDEDPYLIGGKDMLLLNHWRPELIKELEGQGYAETADNGWKLLQGTGDETVVVTFTVSGFDYDNESAKAEEPADASSDQAAATSEKEASKSSSTPVVVIIVGVVVVVVIAGGVVSKKRKK